MYQVYRLTPVIGTYYEYTEADTVTCVYPNQIHFSKTKPNYVGQFIKKNEYGYCDNKETIYHFKNNITKKIHVIRLSYEGRSCFREVPGINIDYIENRKQMLEFMKGSISINSPVQKLEGISDISELIMNHLFELPYTHSE